ncbi:hypothetical protein [Chryseobacterium edaphi]|uniref:hypothetical protein n=1 Tax=Chryseobacterium edaphi TaxID=2976532 RepID=UPI0021D608E7|nr:hypothetical protein [Chryseobacterium edaphi]
MILNPDETFGLDKGFEAVFIVNSAGISSVTTATGFTFISSFFSTISIFEGNFTSCFS